MAIYNENGVPILAAVGGKHGLARAALDAVEGKHSAAVKALEKKGADAHSDHLYTGHAVLVDNRDPARADYTPFTIGGSTLDEALKEVIGAFDHWHVGDPGVPSDHIHSPAWVASTSEDIAKYLGAYYGCEVRDLSEVL